VRLPTGPTSNNFSCETISNVFSKFHSSYFAAMICLSAFLCCFHDSDLAAQNVNRFSKLFFILRQCSFRIPIRALTISVGGPELIINNHLPTLQFDHPNIPHGGLTTIQSKSKNCCYHYSSRPPKYAT